MKYVNVVKISLKFVPKGTINTISALVQITAWPDRRQAIVWAKDGLVYWCIYVSLGLNELIYSWTFSCMVTEIYIWSCSTYRHMIIWYVTCRIYTTTQKSMPCSASIIWCIKIPVTNMVIVIPLFRNEFVQQICEIAIHFLIKSTKLDKTRTTQNFQCCLRLEINFEAWQATSHYLSQWWRSILKHICVTRIEKRQASTIFFRCITFQGSLYYATYYKHTNRTYTNTLFSFGSR